MREWFIVGSKLLGLYFLYTVVMTTLNSSGVFLSMLTSSNNFFPEEGSKAVLLITVLTIAAEMASALPLLFKAEWIADKLKLPSAQTGSFRSENEILQPGIILIGIYIFAVQIGRLAKVLALSRETVRMASPFAATQPAGLSISRDFIDPGLTIFISLCLIFGAKYITTFLTKKGRLETEQQAPLDRE